MSFTLNSLPTRHIALLLAVAVITAACGGSGTGDSGGAASPAPSSDGGTPAPTPTPTPVANPVTDLLANAQEARYGGVLVLANRGDPPAGFDPMRTSSIALHHVGGGLFGPGNLVTRCRQNLYLPCPNLATSWFPNPGFTEWTFVIRNDVTWHDGAPFTAEDAKFWFDLAAFGAEAEGRSRAPAFFRGELGDIKSVEVLPFNQLRVSLRQPNPQYLAVLSNPRFKMAHPRHLMQPRIEEGEVSVAPIDVGLTGTGPFELDRYEPGSLLRLRRFDGYWEKDAAANLLPYLAGIDFVMMPTASVMDAAFRTGRLDGGARGEGHYLTVERKVGYDRDLGDRAFYAHIQGGIFRLGFNVLKEGPWQDVRVRQAISLWIDKQAAIPSALGGFGYLSPTLSLSNPFTNRAFVNWPRFNREALPERREEARTLMAAAGYNDGFSMGYLCRSRLVARCEFLQGQLAGLNIDLKLQVVDEGEWNRGRVSLDYDSQPGAHFTSPIPEGTGSVFGRYAENPDAYSKHDDKLVDDFYRRLREARDQGLRVSVWRELEEYIIREQAYVVPIAGSIQVVGYRTYVKGLIIPPEDGHTHTDFATVWFDK